MREPDWTWKEIDFLRTNYSKMTNAELARKLGRTYGAVITRAYRMGLKKNGNKLIEWTPQKLKLLTDFFPIMFNDALAKWLGVSRRTLTRKAKELGLKKRDDFYQYCTFWYQRSFYERKYDERYREHKKNVRYFYAWLVILIMNLIIGYSLL